jgi:archaellum component FlaF (FlaF/FlaG flagellin family)
VTTVTVANDSGSFDAGLSAVSYGLLSAVNPIIDADMVHRKGTAVASAATTDIWGIAGDFVHVTGVVTITSLGTAPYAGAERTIIFDGALVLTQNATSLILPGATNIFTAAGDRATVRADTTANMIVTSYVRSSGLPAVGTSLPRSYLAGLTLSTAGGSATMTISAGQAVDGTNAVMMNLANSLAKTTAGGRSVRAVAWIRGDCKQHLVSLLADYPRRYRRGGCADLTQRDSSDDAGQLHAEAAYRFWKDGRRGAMDPL